MEYSEMQYPCVLCILLLYFSLLPFLFISLNHRLCHCFPLISHFHFSVTNHHICYRRKVNCRFVLSASLKLRLVVVCLCTL